MIKSIFKQRDFKLVTLPPPINPPEGQYPSASYPNAPVHMGVHYVRDGFKGSKVWASNSPYPNNDHWENPCVWQSDDSIYPPEKFSPYIKNPIIGKIGAPNYEDKSFSSDPDIIIAKGELLVINREWWRDPHPNNIIVNLYKGVFDGNTLVNFTPSIKLFEGYGTEYTGVNIPFFASQALHYDDIGDKYVMFDICSNSWNSANDQCLAVRKAESVTLYQNCFSEWSYIAFHGYKIEPWHMSVFGHEGKLYSIMCAPLRGKNGNDSGRIYLGEFNEDLTALYIHDKALTDFRTYRSDAFVDENGLFVLYANSFGYTFNGGTGETGKDVFVTTRPFDDIIRQLRN